MSNLRRSIIEEFERSAEDYVNNGIITYENKDEWRFYLFNEDYYIIGYYNASEWLKEHDFEPFEAISICQEYEKDNFGECRIYDNSETTANMLAYVLGEEWLYSVGEEFIEELLEEMY